MRTLTIADNWKDWKFGDTDAVMTFTALDDDKVPDFSNRTLTFKIASTLNNDLEHPKDFAATATGYIQGKDVILKTEDVKQLPPGNYIVELWAMSNDTQKDAVYPSKGFAQFTIEENSMKVSDVTNVPSMTINAFWNAVMQKVRTLTKGAKGDPGKTPKIVIGSVTKLSPDAQPSATLVPLQSDPNTYTLNLQLPQGVQGEQGLQGIPGVGSKGLDGNNGLTPTIDPKTKHWMIGGTDTGVIAEGQAGKDADPSKYVTIVSFNQLRQQVQNNATALDVLEQKIETQTIDVFDSVDDMKHNASSLIEGMKVRTLSYYDKPADPHGGCLYKVCTAKTNLPAVDLGNGLYAVPILEHSRVMNAACFGIKVNSDDDQADAIQTFLNSVPYNYKAYFPAGSYVLGHGIKINGNGEIFGDTTNTLNASWNGTAFFFKNLVENTVAIDAHADGKQTVHNLWIQIEGAYTFEEDRTKAKTTTDKNLVSPFTITKTTSGIVGLYIGGYGSIAKDNVVLGASEVGIKSDAFCQICNNQIWDSSTGIRALSDMQISGNRVQHCEFGLDLQGTECNVINERYDSISEMGFLLKRAHGSNLVNVQVDYCGGPGIMLNNTGNCHISTQIGRTGIYYAGTEADDLASPTFAAGIALTGSSSYNHIDITQDYAGIFDNGTPDVRAPRYKVVTGQYYDAADTHAYHNDITLSGGGLDVQPGTKLTVDQLKRFMFIAGAPNHVVFSGSVTIFGTTYYYSNTDSTYDQNTISRVPVIGYNDTPAITLSTLNIKGNINGDKDIAENMDLLTSTGIYGWNGYAMTTSANLPPEKDLGVLLVMNTDDKVTQSILGCNTVQSRVYSGTSWSPWNKANLA